MLSKLMDLLYVMKYKLVLVEWVHIIGDSKDMVLNLILLLWLKVLVMDSL